jgi:hypothetical protein
MLYSWKANVPIFLFPNCSTFVSSLIERTNGSIPPMLLSFANIAVSTHGIAGPSLNEMLDTFSKDVIYKQMPCLTVMIYWSN